jgi:amidase/aspartyl-tRNA(Asn)/glutamyl-tRNA(Gln) amidotransferase subunit A
MSDDIFWSPASELSRSYRRKELSPVELVDHVLQRMERLQTQLNFLVLSD